jgi:putative membrane protein
MFNNPQFLLMNKAITVFFWVAVIANYAIGFPEPLGPLLGLAGPLIFAAHVIEVIFFLRKYKSGSENVALDSVLILVLGIFHFMPIIQKVNNQA